MLVSWSGQEFRFSSRFNVWVWPVPQKGPLVIAMPGCGLYTSARTRTHTHNTHHTHTHTTHTHTHTHTHTYSHSFPGAYITNIIFISKAYVHMWLCIWSAYMYLYLIVGYLLRSLFFITGMKKYMVSPS